MAAAWQRSILEASCGDVCGWDEIFSRVHCSDVEKIVPSLSRNKGSGLDKN